MAPIALLSHGTAELSPFHGRGLSTSPALPATRSPKSEHPQLEGARKDLGVQLPALHSTTQKSDRASESVV